MKKKFFRWLIKWFVIKLNLYLLWSRFHQWAFQRKRLAIPRQDSLKNLEEMLGQSVWSADGWKELWDVVAHPEFAYQKFVNSGTYGDCDDYSVVAAEVCNRDLFPKQVAKVLAVQWLRNGKFVGHNVCIFIYEGNELSQYDVIENPYITQLDNGNEIALGWIGNYFRGRAKLGYSSIEDIVKAIVADGVLIAYFVYDHRCKQIETSYISKD